MNCSFKAAQMNKSKYRDRATPALKEPTGRWTRRFQVEDWTSLLNIFFVTAVDVVLLQTVGLFPPLCGPTSRHFWARWPRWAPPSLQIPECIIYLPSPTPRSPPHTARTCLLLHLLPHHLLLWATVVRSSRAASTMDRINSSTPWGRTATSSQRWPILLKGRVFL